MRIPRNPIPLFAAVLLWTLSALAASPNTGTWTATAREDKLNLSFRFEERSQMGLTVPRSAFQGLNTADGADTKFQLVREAGTLNFEGRFSGGEGAGHYQFAPSASYRQEMAKLGYTEISPLEQLQLAIFDVGPARVKALAELGYTKMSHDQLLQVAIFQVTPEHIRELAGLGYLKLTFDELLSTRIHRITPQFISEAKGLGLGELSLEDLLTMRIHRVTPEYVREIREAGYPDVTLKQLVEMRIHAIDANYVRSLSRNKNTRGK
ncbi:4-hydroxy-3-methylbut-2-enyl diphosphate reductase [Archangium violaceum]|uniref:4-hydroxy-3-methylbut-2-enyl diphosphate reductase n=1 Tax=Archangium violaceum TaxID=83451 RepID=UPI00193B6EAC|nr:4-hydroxy-3-methylbut-2-enyl diphosphate reductase [Archangium violaceum]QRK10711.1 4-hydroxy-3-methylbut-2-enyl diphosphate reductase [Archangium violaceum]